MGGGERVAQWFEWRRGMATDILDAFSAREARLDALWTPVGQNHLHPRPATERSATFNLDPQHGFTTHIRHPKAPCLSFNIWTHHSRHVPLFENISIYCAAELYSSLWTALSASSISCPGLFPTSTPRAFSGIVRQVLYKSRVLQETPSKNRQICSSSSIEQSHLSQASRLPPLPSRPYRRPKACPELRRPLPGAK